MTSRQYKWALLVLVVSGLVGGLLGSWLLPGRAASAQEQVVTAREFRLVDKEGKLWGSLSLNVEGFLPGKHSWPCLGFLDENGEPRAMLALGEDERAALCFFDEAGNQRVSLALGDGGQPSLALSDENVNPRAVLALCEDGQPGLVLWDENENSIWSAP